MTNLLTDYQWPPTAAGAPVWRGDHFDHEGKAGDSVIIYDETESHWSEELTTVHETEAGEGDHPLDRASRDMAMQSLKRYVPTGAGIVLDVGCSSGFLLRDLRRKTPDRAVMGADYISGPLKKLNRELPEVPLLQFDLRNCPLPTGSLAAVVSLNVLEHIDRDEQALGHIHRVLKQGGIAHIEVPAGPSCYDIYDEYLMHHRRYTMSELHAKAEQAGFEVVHQTHLGALAFPAFYFVKRRNRRYLTLPAAEKESRVRQMMRSTRRSRLMEYATALELFFGKYISYPMGIRCVIVLRKK